MSDRKEKRAQFEADKKQSMVPLLAIGLLLVIGSSLISWKFLGPENGKDPVFKAVAVQSER